MFLNKCISDAVQISLFFEQFFKVQMRILTVGEHISLYFYEKKKLLTNFKTCISELPGCIPYKTYAKGTPIPKLLYARYFQGKRAAKNLSNDDFDKLRFRAQILSFL